jgi:hypothetical protein
MFAPRTAPDGTPVLFYACRSLQERPSTILLIAAGPMALMAASPVVGALASLGAGVLFAIHRSGFRLLVTEERLHLRDGLFETWRHIPLDEVRTARALSPDGHRPAEAGTLVGRLEIALARETLRVEDVADPLAAADAIVRLAGRRRLAA